MAMWSGLVKSRVGAVATFALVTVAAAMVAGCASDKAAAPADGGGPTTGTGQNFCGFTSVTAASGSACDTAGRACDIGYACGAFSQQAHCACTAGAFVCTDSTGATVDKGGAPLCTSNGTGNDKACPASVASASTKACSTAGLLCNYPGVTCANGNQLNDTCQCVGSNAAGGGLAFNCTMNLCPGTNPGTAPDAGTAVDASTPVDSGIADAKTGG